MSGRSHRIALLVALWISAPSFAEPVISEFVAKNSAGIVDEDGGHGDWIEIHNPSSAAQNMDGWYLTDKASSKTKWKFPAVTIEPGGFLIVWADSKDRRIPSAPLHTNFALDNDGEYLGLIRPDGTTVWQEFAPTFPPQSPDRSFGLIFERTTLIGAGANADYRVPTTAADIAADWKTATPTPAGWTLQKPTGLGFGFSVPGMTITVRAKNTATGLINSQADAEALLTAPSGDQSIASETITVQPAFNFLGEGSDAHYDDNQTLPAGVFDNYVCHGQGTLTIPTAGVWTFGLNSDDGGRIVIDGITVMDDPTAHGPEDHLAQVTLSAGDHTFEVWYFEQGGGDEGEFYAAPGAFDYWDESMKLVGDTAHGGLTCFTALDGPASGSAIVKTNLEPAMRGVNASAFVRVPFNASGSGFTSLSLSLRYNDGFTAWLNGTLLTSANAPVDPGWDAAATAARSTPQSFVPAIFNLTAALPTLTGGTNILALQGHNTSATDGTFLLQPELIAGKLPASRTTAYFDTPTPGGINTAPSSLGKVATIDFSPKRGVFPNSVVTTTPFNVTLSTTTSGATIRYTTDGTAPSETAGTVYTGPISIATTTTLRAIAYRSEYEPSKVSTDTYILPEDVIRQSPTGLQPNPTWPLPDNNGYVGGQRIDYGMDPDIVNHADEAIGGVAQVKSALRAIPSLSIVMPNHDLFDVDNGIYVHPNGRGLAAERPCSIEWLNDPMGGFQEDCGMRIRGGYSRSGGNPKHAFHFYFRKTYGHGHLDYAFFGTAGANEFDQIDFRTSQNYSWSFGGDPNNTFLREEFCRQTQLDMGWPGSRTRYCQLYINGQYWGLYNTDERTEAAHCANYIGGNKDDWDVVKSEQDSGYSTGATDGNLAAWDLLFTKANPLATPGTFTRRSLTTTEYYDLMGRGPDGVTPNGSPVLLDVDNLIDYLLITFWTGNLDGATSAFLGDNAANNWFGARDRTGSRGFVFFVHDFEHTLFSPDEDRTGPFVPAITDEASYNSKRDYYNPMFLHADLLSVPEYRQRWQERVQLHLFNGGALSPAVCVDRISRLASIVDTAIVAESARWGDAQRNDPLTRADWRGARDYLLTYIPQRGARVIAQLRADGLYPAVGGVTITPPGGYVSSSTQIDMTGGTSGTIYYTVNGPDPKLANGLVSPRALVFTHAEEVRDDFIAGGSTWKYRAPSADLGLSEIVAGSASWDSTNWKHPAFDDSDADTWKSGPAKLGSGDGDEATAVDIGQSGARYPVVYFRRHFTVTNPGQYSALELDVKRDDGAIIYINGHEVGRSNMPGGAVGYDYTGLGVGGEDESTFFPVTDLRLLPGVLVDGENTIAVEIHQANADSSDLSFDLRLRGVRSEVSDPVVLPAGQSIVRARERYGINWGALSEVTFFSDVERASTANLVISELHYHPAETTAAEDTAGFNDDTFFEYVELMNIGTKTIDLFGINFDAGITWTFDATATASRLLAPGARVLVVANPTASVLRYGSSRTIAGKFSGALDNDGDTLALRDASDAIIRSFAYSNDAPWPTAANGFGPSLVLKAPLTNPDHSDPTSWTLGDAPAGALTAVDDSYVIQSNRANVIDALANDSTSGSGILTITTVGAASHGTAVLTGGMVTYTPGPSFITADAFTYTVTNGLGRIATANVAITNPIAVNPGSYASPITLAGVPKGSLTLKLSGTGAITGRLILNGKTYTFKTKASPLGAVTIHLKRPRLPDLVFAVNIFALGGLDQTSGTITDGTNTYVVESQRRLASTLPAGLSAGRFTACLPAPATGPGGDGYAAFSLTKAARLTLAGKLGDGTPFLFGTALRTDSTLVIDRPLYAAPRGYLHGSVVFAAAADSRAHGSLAWVKPPQTKPGAQLYANGFNTSVDFLASAYAAPKQAPTLNYPTGHAQFDLLDGSVTPLISHRIAVSPTDRITIDDATTNGLSLRINRLNGVMTGSFIHPLSGNRAPLGGVIYQQTNRATGFFIGTDATGRFELRPE